MQTNEGHDPSVAGTHCSEDRASLTTKGDDFGSDATAGIVKACERLLNEGNITEAKQELRSLEAVTPATEQEWESIHSICLKLNDRTSAQVYTERFLRLHEDCASANLANARNFMATFADRAKVQKSLSAALRNPGSDSDFWREVARIQSAVHDHESACQSARKAIWLEPTDLDMRELLISSLGTLQRGIEVRKECGFLADGFVQSNMRDPLRWARLSRIAAEAGARRKAKRYIDVADKYLSRADYGAEFELIRALILTNQAKRAKDHLENFLNSNSQNSWLWSTLLEMAMVRRYYDIVLVAVARLKALPYQDPEFLYRLSLTEKAASRKQGIFLLRLIRRWTCPYG